MTEYKGTVWHVLELYKQGHTIENIAKGKALKIETVQRIIEEATKTKNLLG